MFRSIYTLAKQTPLSLLVTAVGDRLRVIVVPSLQKDAKEETVPEGLTEPLLLEGSPEELDAQFAQLLTEFTTERKSLSEQLAVTTAVLKATKEKSAKEAARSLSKSPKANAVSEPSANQQKSSVIEDEDNDEVENTVVNSSSPDGATNDRKQQDTTDVANTLALF